MTVFLFGKPLTFGDLDQIREVKSWDKCDEYLDVREPVGPEFFSINILCGRPPTFGDLEQIEEIERCDRLYRLEDEGERLLRVWGDV
jgi:hypothetical protein